MLFLVKKPQNIVLLLKSEHFNVGNNKIGGITTGSSKMANRQINSYFTTKGSKTLFDKLCGQIVEGGCFHINRASTDYSKPNLHNENYVFITKTVKRVL